MSSIAVFFGLVAAIVILVIVARKRSARRQAEAKAAAQPKAKKKIVACQRDGYNITTAYFLEDLPRDGWDNCYGPVPGAMLFSSDRRLPNLGTTVADLKRLAQETDREIVWHGEYSLFAVGTTRSDVEQEVREVCGNYITNFGQAVERGKRLAAA